MFSISIYYICINTVERTVINLQNTGRPCNDLLSSNSSQRAEPGAWRNRTLIRPPTPHSRREEKQVLKSLQSINSFFFGFSLSLSLFGGIHSGAEPSALSGKEDSEGNVLPCGRAIWEGDSGKLRTLDRPGKEGKITIGLEKVIGVF